MLVLNTLTMYLTLQTEENEGLVENSFRTPEMMDKSKSKPTGFSVITYLLENVSE